MIERGSILMCDLGGFLSNGNWQAKEKVLFPLF